MTEELTVNEAKESRKALEARIQDLVNEFSELTGLIVEDVDIDNQFAMSGGTFAIVSIRVILPS